ALRGPLRGGPGRHQRPALRGAAPRSRHERRPQRGLPVTITAALRGRRLWPRRAAMLVCLVIAAMLVAPGLAAAQPPAPPPPPGQPGPTTPPPNPLVPSDPQT